MNEIVFEPPEIQTPEDVRRWHDEMASHYEGKIRSYGVVPSKRKWQEMANMHRLMAAAIV